MELAALRYSQGPCYRGALPGGRPVMRGLLLDQEALAACFPFSDENPLDPDGVFVGVNERTGVSVLWNRARPDVHHMLVTGDTGYGKSYAVKALLSQEAVLGWPLLLLDPSAKREYQPFIAALGGAYLDLARAGTERINIFEIVPDRAAAERGMPRVADGTHIRASWFRFPSNFGGAVPVRTTGTGPRRADRGPPVAPGRARGSKV